MTQHKHLKQLVRERQQKTGDSYSTALMHIRAQQKAAGAPQREPDSDPVLRPTEAQPAALTPVEPPAATPLTSWAARHSLDAQTLRQLEQMAIKDAGRSIDLDKLVACAKAVLIGEMLDGAPRRDRPYTKMPGEAMRVNAIGAELEILPSDTTPTSYSLVHGALDVAAAFSNGAEWQIQAIRPVGRLYGATAQARKAAVRFLRLAGARVLIWVSPVTDKELAGSAAQPVADGPMANLPARAEDELAALNAYAGGMQARALIDQADDLHGPAAERLLDDAEQRLTAALRQDASNCTMLSYMGKLRLSQARGAVEQGARQLLEDALRWFDRAIAIKADFFIAKVGHGDALVELSRRDPAQRDTHLAAAIHDYRGALQIRSDLYLARVGLGTAYLEGARHRGGGGAAKLLMDAQREFAAALELKPSLYRALVGLGDGLVERSKKLSLAEAQTALDSAWAHYQRALQLRPSLYSALCGCGDVELERARRSDPASAGRSRATAMEMYDRALAIQPSSYRAANGRRAALDASL